MNKIFKIPKDIERAKSLIKSSKKKLSETKRIYKLVSKETIIENYYEIIKELIVALMYIDGYKTLSHITLIEFLKKYYNKPFTNIEFVLIDDLRIKRNKISYYGKEINKSFLYQKEKRILNLIKKFFNLLDKKF